MYEFKVEGMTCGSCAGAITRALKTLDPDVKVAVDLRSQTVRVTSEEKLKDLEELISEAGYPVLGAKEIEAA